MNKQIAVTLTAQASGLLRGFAASQAAVSQFARQSETSMNAAKAAVVDYEKAFSSSQAAVARTAGLLRNTMMGALGGVTAMGVIDMADQWGQYASRIRMATRSTEEYNQVQARMLESANRTYRSIEETREGFIQMSPTLRDMGLSLEQSMDAVDAFSGLLVVNSASAERGGAALAAYSKSLQKGKIDAYAWATIGSTMPTVIDLIATSTNRTAEEVRKLGAEGKLSVQDLTNALVSNIAEINKQVDSMPTTVRDALGKVRNSFIEYVGWNNEATGATAALASGIGFLGENLGTVLTVAMVASGAALTRYTSGMALATMQTIAKIVQERRLAQAQVEQTKATLAQATAMRALGATQAQVTAATIANEAATKRLAAAQAAYTAVGRGALAMLGGPAGIAVAVGLAATAFLSLRGATDSASETIDDFGKKVDILRSKVNELTDAQTRQALQEIQEPFRAAQDEVKVLGARIEWLQRQLAQHPNSKEAENWNRALIQAQGEFDTASQRAEAYKNRIAELEGQLKSLGAAAAVASAASAADDVVAKFLEGVQKNIISLNTGTSAVARANQVIFENQNLTEGQKKALLAAAGAEDELRKMTQAGTKAIKDRVSAMKSVLDTHLPENKALEDLHKNLDLLDQARQAGKLSVQDYDKALKSINETYAKSLESTQKQTAMEKVLGELREQQTTTQIQFMRDLEAFGQGDRIRELNADLAKVEDRYRSLVEARRNSAQGLSDEDLAKIKESLQKELDIVRWYHDEKLKKSQDWGLGARDALINYADEAGNVYNSVGELVGKSFKGMEDALVDFTRTGKLNFKSLADSIISDMMRIAIQQSATKPLAGLFGTMITKGLGLLSGNIDVGSLSIDKGLDLGATLPGAGSFTPVSSFSWSTGGFTGEGGRYDPAGIVHKGEGVLNQDEIRAIGGEPGFNALRRAIRGGGHAVGGMGGKPMLPPPGFQAQQQPSIVINSTLNAAPGTDVAAMEAAMQENNEQLKYEIFEALRRGRVEV